jgi:hypothetical protein
MSQTPEVRMSRIACLSVVFLAAATLCFAQAPKTPTLSYMEGSVTINGQQAAIGDEVPLGSVIMTSEQSLADIEFNTRNVVRLSEKTTLVFNPRNLQTGSELRRGALTLVLKNLSAGSAGENFLVRTPSTVAGVRGTSFFIKVESPSSTYVCACNGTVQVLDADGSLLRELVASHHRAVSVSDSSGKPQVLDAPMLYHTDKDLDAVAADIGYTIDWSVVDK